MPWCGRTKILEFKAKGARIIHCEWSEKTMPSRTTWFLNHWISVYLRSLQLIQNWMILSWEIRILWGKKKEVFNCQIILCFFFFFFCLFCFFCFGFGFVFFNVALLFCSEMINKKNVGGITGTEWNYLLAITSMHAYIIVWTLIFIDNAE